MVYESVNLKLREKIGYMKKLCAYFKSNPWCRKKFQISSVYIFKRNKYMQHITLHIITTQGPEK